MNRQKIIFLYEWFQMRGIGMIIMYFSVLRAFVLNIIKKVGHEFKESGRTLTKSC